MTNVWKTRFIRCGLIAGGVVLSFVAGLLIAARAARRANTSEIDDPIKKAQAQVEATRAALKAMSDKALLDLFNKNTKGAQ